MPGTAIELWDPYWEQDTDIHYFLWMMYQESRGALAFVPETMECYECSGYHEPYVERRVVSLGKPVVIGGYYPTGEPVDCSQSYNLECGHMAIAF